MENRRGLSDVIATVLIILLVLAAVVIVWSFVSPSITKTGEQIDIESKCLVTEVKPIKCVVNAANATGSIQLVRGSPDKVKLIIKSADEQVTPGVSVDAPLQALETVSEGVVVNGVQGTAPYKASTVATFMIEEKEYPCRESPTTITCT